MAKLIYSAIASLDGYVEDTQGGFAFCIGGNESDSIRRTVVRLTPQGLIKQREGNSFICVIKNLK